MAFYALHNPVRQIQLHIQLLLYEPKSKFSMRKKPNEKKTMPAFRCTITLCFFSTFSAKLHLNAFVFVVRCKWECFFYAIAKCRIVIFLLLSPVSFSFVWFWSIDGNCLCIWFWFCFNEPITSQPHLQQIESNRMQNNPASFSPIKQISMRCFFIRSSIVDGIECRFFRLPRGQQIWNQLLNALISFIVFEMKSSTNGQKTIYQQIPQW